MTDPRASAGGSTGRTDLWPAAVCSAALFALAILPFLWVLREPFSAGAAIRTNGSSGSPVRSPASTWPTGMRR